MTRASCSSTALGRTPSRSALAWIKSGATRPFSHRQQPKLGSQTQGLKTNTAGSCSEVPDHTSLRQSQLRQQLNSHLPFGHQTGMVAVLQKDAVLDSEQGQGIRRCR